MKKYLLLFFLFVNINAFSQTTGKNIVIGTIDSLYSNILNEYRKIWVYVPDKGNGLFSKKLYPVVYLLDGDAHFQSVAGIIHHLSETYGNSVIPEMILVGILNTDRKRDLTPTQVSVAPYLDSTYLITTGGGDNFRKFMKNELLPYIESVYPASPYRMIIGHSYGGLTVLSTLINQPEMFNTYVSIDPNLFWSDRKLLKDFKNVLGKENLNGRTLFLAAANTMQPGMDTSDVLKDTKDNTLHIRTILELAKYLDSNPINGLRFKWEFYEKEDHSSVPLIAAYDAFRFIFDYYKFTSETDPELPSAKELSDHFKMVSGKFGYEILPPEDYVNSSGYYFLQSGNFNKAFTFFNLNLLNYPDSFNTYDSMGDYYEAKGEIEKAKEFFIKATELNDNPATRQKLEGLSK